MSEMGTVGACVICDEPQRFRWTDTHGVGACVTCGATYKLYHYEGEGDAQRRVDRPPELTLPDWYIPFARRYWQEEGRNVYPGGHNFPGSSYEVATPADFERFRDWIEAHRDEIEAARAPLTPDEAHDD